VLRGGSWLNDGPDLFRCAYRNLHVPENRYNFLYGFRVARTLTP